MKSENLQPLVEITRGAIVESIHFGALAVVDSSGKLLASAGDPQTVTYLRSSAKPFQALPFIEMGGADAFGLSDREVALMCASHSGSDMHVAVARGMQLKIGVGEQDMLCGTHPVSDEKTMRAMILRGEEPSPIRHNCSGKHTGMLAHAKLRAAPLADYVNPRHPIQQVILQTFAEMVGLQVDEVVVGIDGCSAPNFAVPLYNAAWGFARLCDPAQHGSKRAEACQRITRAMMTNPDMIAGVGKFDTCFMQVAGGKLVAKGGAEGYQCIGIMPETLSPGSPAIGIAFKVSDGDETRRASQAVSLELVRQLGLSGSIDLASLTEFDNRPIYNWRKLEVGELKTCFKL
jgi:L-asparaginase II